jgi:drug/metabolite transporter (DMT)-like permease
LLGATLGLDRPTWKGVLGVGLSIVGVALVVLDGLTSENASLLGDLLVLIAAFCVGAYAVLSMPLLERHTQLAVATYPVLFGIPFLLLISSPQMLSLEWGSVGAGPWTAVAYSAWQRGRSRIGANRVLVYQYLITIVGATSGIVFFGETLGINKIAGGVVILLGVYLARRQ